MKQNVLYLGSNSYFRKMLLTESLIPFVVVGHAADEESVDPTLSLEDQVRYLAQLKIDHIMLSDGVCEGQVRYALTADSMVSNDKGEKYSKPHDMHEAYEKIRTMSGLQKVATGYCVQKRIWKNNQWVVDRSICDVNVTTFTFKVPQSKIDAYFKHTNALESCGAIVSQGYGLQFMQFFNGSYSGAVGLPLFEVRTILEDWGFFD